MRKILKYAVATALTGALALAVVTPSEARHGRNAAIIGGVAAATVFGLAAAANANASYNGYYVGPGYYYEPAPYAYQGGPVYQGAPVFVEPRNNYRYGTSAPSCASEGPYGHVDYGAC
jgi:hypothetical protein